VYLADLLIFKHKQLPSHLSIGLSLYFSLLHNLLCTTRSMWCQAFASSCWNQKF